MLFPPFWHSRFMAIGSHSSRCTRLTIQGGIQLHGISHLRTAELPRKQNGTDIVRPVPKRTKQTRLSRLHSVSSPHPRSSLVVMWPSLKSHCPRRPSARACEELILKWLWFLPDLERKLSY